MISNATAIDAIKGSGVSLFRHMTGIMARKIDEQGHDLARADALKSAARQATMLRTTVDGAPAPQDAGTYSEMTLDNLYIKSPLVRVRCAEVGMTVLDDDRTLRVLGSSSAGNCYLLSIGGEHLVIEAGMDLRPLKEALKWDFRHVAGCVITHQHGDHAGRVKDMLGLGVHVFALPEVFSATATEGHPMARAVRPMRRYRIGGFNVLPMPVAHDVPCVAYVIEHEGMGRTLFLTDAMMLEYRVPGVVHWMVEANYTDGELDARVARGDIPASVARRTRTTHMSLSTAIDLLCANDLSKTKDVMFIHLSADGGQAVKGAIAS